MASLLCCAACEACSCACCLGKCLCFPSTLSKKTANVIYLLVFISATLLSLILQEWGAPHFDIYSFNIGCEDIPDINVDSCKGDSAVYRISAGLALWFLVIAFGNICSKRFHTGLWGLKCISLVLMLVGFFFVPASIFGEEGYVMLARFLSAFFLISQIITFIDAAYNWNGFFQVKVEDENNIFWKFIATCLFSVCCLGSWTAIVLLYVYFDSCTLSTVFITVTILLIIAATVFQVNLYKIYAEDDVPPGSLLSSCIVATYCVYLCWSAISANPDTCNTIEQNKDQVFVGMFVTACSIGWTCYSASSNYDDSDSDEEEEEESHSSYVPFHLIMATGSVYMSMLLTNWGTSSGKKSEVQMWVSISSQWISILLYIWTLIAPKCCTNRQYYEDL